MHPVKAELYELRPRKRCRSPSRIETWSSGSKVDHIGCGHAHLLSDKENIPLGWWRTKIKVGELMWTREHYLIIITVTSE